MPLHMALVLCCSGQRQLDGSVKPVSYASKSLTPTEQKYAQIEKEALGVTWACEHFVEPQVQGHESEGQYEAPSLYNPNASGSHKQQELVQPRPVITRSGRVSKPPNRL